MLLPASIPTGRRCGGEWRVERQRLRWDVLDAFAEAAVQAGIARSDDFNRGDNAGVGYFEVNQRRGWRWSTARAFLAPARRRGVNLDVWTGTLAQYLTFAQDDSGRLRCTGAEVRTARGEMVRVTARSEVVVCAGAVGAPHLLQRSGLGPGALLQARGVAVRRDLPGVGENLQDHLQVRAVYTVEGVPTLNTRARSLWGKALIGLEYALRRTGPMSMAPSAWRQLS